MKQACTALVFKGAVHQLEVVQVLFPLHLQFAQRVSLMTFEGLEQERSLVLKFGGFGVVLGVDYIGGEQPMRSMSMRG
jgi:hypothetical protein